MASRNHQLILFLLLILATNPSLELENDKLLNSSSSNAKFKSAISDLLQNYKPSLSGKQALKVKALHDVMRPAISNNLLISDQYKCAKYCACSMIQIVDKSKNEKRANLTQAKCESAHFADVLTIDRRTQIIHISLPQESAGISENSATISSSGDQAQAKSFRMPRLVQFNILREIVIINLKFEVCDSEVFKRGQRLRRFQLNYNQLNRISKACLRHLEKLIELNLDNNKLEELESALFSNLISLKSLSIAHNQLSELAAHQFANLTNLVSLNLVGNSFKTINLHLFEPMQSSLRLLLLAKNQIKSFVHTPNQQQQLIPISTVLLNTNTNSSFAIKSNATSLSKSLFSGVVFKNLMKLNVDSNKIERIKQLQLHRFFNIKYLSVRHNNIATIRDKAFNGLKLIELNLAHNQLQSISKCSFCNATIKRLVLSNNNISLPLPSQTMLLPEPPIPRPQANIASNESLQLPNPLAQLSGGGGGFSQQQEPPPEATSSQNMLILSQSIFGPLFGQLEYLDLSSNQLLADQLEFLLEPLLKLEYLNIASVGLDRSLPSPTLFKNLRQLRYLNLSHNQLDQLIAETVEPLTSLEALDMSYNKFSEFDESFLVTLDELNTLKIINFGNNPWYCSQCKVAPLYDWILRSPIYNQSCIAPTLELQELRYKQDIGSSDQDQESDSDLTTEEKLDGLTYNPHVARGPQDYNLLISDDDKTLDHSAIDFDLILGNSLFEGDRYNLLDGSDPQQQTNWGFRELLNSEDDSSISQTMAIISNSEAVQFNPLDYCLKCEFPRELHTFNIHELSSGDFKFCAGATPRFMASEPKIGLTLAIVIIGALFCIIIVVIVMYRRKSNTYYTNEDTDHLEGGEKQVRSMSSDIDHQYGDATDYSSPPMSQSYESYSQEDEEDDRDEEEDDLEDEDEEEDEDDEVTGNSARDSIGRRAVAEEERRHQLAEYNQRSEHKTSKGSQSIKSNQSRASPATSGSISRKTDRKSEVSMHSSGSTKQPRQHQQQRVAEKPLWGEASLESRSTHDVGPLNELMMKSALKSSPSSSSQVATPAKAVSKDSTRDEGNTHVQERSYLTRKLESDGSFKHRRLADSRDGPTSEFDYEATRSASSSQRPTSKVDKHRAVRSSQTIYQLSYGLRPQSNTARSQSSANANNLQKSTLPNQTSGKQRTTFSQLSRQRFAQSKEASELAEPEQLDKTAVMDVQLLEPTRRADFLHMVHQDRVHTPSGASDATTADSIALEALDYLPSDLEDLEEPQPGGALEMNSSSPEGERDDRQHHPYDNRDYLQL